MSTFTQASFPSPVTRGLLEESWQSTAAMCNEVFQRFSEHQLSKIAGWIPHDLASANPKSKVKALLAVYGYEIDQIRAMAVGTESFRRLSRKDQDLLKTKITLKVSDKRLERLVELLKSVQENEIQIEKKIERDRCSSKSERRRRQAEKLERQTVDRQRTLQTKGMKRAGPRRRFRR